MRILNFADFFFESKTVSDIYAIGAKGEEVKKIQQKLIDLGFLKISVPTGNYQVQTKKAVEAFQKDKGRKSGLLVDGMVGPLTWKVLLGTPFVPSTTRLVDSGVKKTPIDPNISNKKASLFFNGLALKWLVNGKPIKEWKAISGVTYANMPISTTGKSFYQKLSNIYNSLADIKQKAWDERMNMTGAQAAAVKGFGPTVPGKYKIGKLESRSGELVDAKSLGKNQKEDSFSSNSEISKIAWGNYRAPLTPYPGQDMFNRDSFYIHGGSIPGSHGCIDLTDQMDDFAKYYIVWQKETGNNSIDLTVDYSELDKSSPITKFWNFLAKTDDQLRRTMDLPDKDMPPNTASTTA